MKKEAKLLKDKAVASLRLSVDHFNRLEDVGRAEVVLILLDHSFEMLLKGSIIYRGGKIRDPGESHTIGFDACVRRALSKEKVQFIDSDQALVLQTINGLRDAAQHHLLTLSEGQLYIHAQSGVTLFRDILKSVFNEELADYLPDRALPISTVVPADPITLFTNELQEVKLLLAPGRRKRTEVDARLRGLAIVDAALQGDKEQPRASKLKHIRESVVSGKSLAEIFPGIGAVDFTKSGSGMRVDLRITKQKGIAVHLVKEGTPGATVVGVKRVDDLGFYSIAHSRLAKLTGLSPPKTTAAVRLLDLKNDADCYKQIVIGKSRFDRYSQEAVKRIKALLHEKTPQEIWNEYNQAKSKVGGSSSG